MRTRTLAYSRYALAAALAVYGSYSLVHTVLHKATSNVPNRSIAEICVFVAIFWGWFLAAAYLLVGGRHRVVAGLWVLIGVSTWIYVLVFAHGDFKLAYSPRWTWIGLLMLSRTKRRLAVLALALGLIAAAPRMFHVAVDLLLPMGNLFGAGTGLGFGAFEYTRSNRGAIFAINPFAVTYMTEAARSSVWLECPRPPYLTIFKLPHASITLRVACAVALAGVWGLLVGGRWLVGRWTRSSPESQTAR